MVRLADLSDAMRRTVTGADCPRFDSRPWTVVQDRRRRRVALVTSAGLHLRGDRPFLGGDGGHRELPAEAPVSDIIMSHVSVNFDRTGFQRDTEVVLPRHRLYELADSGVIGSVSDTHYSFMGAAAPEAMQADARGLARRLLERGVDTAVLLPV